MIDKNALIIRRVIGILTAISVIIAGICLIAGCLSIYFGEGEYSRDLVSEAFAPIAVAVCLCPILAAIGLIAELLLPAWHKKDEKPDTSSATLKRLSAIKNADEAVLKERKSRKLRKAVLVAVLLAAAAVFLVYSLNACNFDRADINTSVIKAMYLLIPCLFVSFVLAFVTEILNKKSIKREIALLKQAEAKSETEKGEQKQSANIIPALRFSILVVALVCLIYGYVFGGTADVMTKAINICTECIGLG